MRINGTTYTFGSWLRREHPGKVLSGAQAGCVARYFLYGRDEALKYDNAHMPKDSKAHREVMSLMAQFILQQPHSPCRGESNGRQLPQSPVR